MNYSGICFICRSTLFLIVTWLYQLTSCLWITFLIQMDSVCKTSESYSTDGDEKYPTYDTIQGMIEGAGISKHSKTQVSAPLERGSFVGHKRNTPVFENDHLNLPNLNKQRNDLHDHRRTYAEQQTLFDELYIRENLQMSVKKLQNKLDTQQNLKDINSDRRSNKECNFRASKNHDGVREAPEELKQILSLKFLSYEDAKKLMELLFDYKVTYQIKLFILSRLEEECLENRDTIRKVFDKSALHLLEELLEKYCCTVSVFGRKNVPIENKPRPPKELYLLKPLIKIFGNVSCYPQSRFLHLELMPLLINAITFIATNVDHIQKKIISACKGEMLTCDMSELDSKDTSHLLSNLIGLHLDDWVSGGYDVVLYGHNGKNMDLNINEEIIRIQPNMNCTKFDNNNKNIVKETASTYTKHITVIRTKAPKYMLMYAIPGWDNHLQEISDHVQMFTEAKDENYFRNGNVVGFYNESVEYDGKILKTAPFMRGLIVSQQKGNVLIWAMDIGCWIYARREKLISLKHSPLNRLEPLVSVGQLKGPVCDVDEGFLIFALSILRHASFKNHEVAKQMFLPDAGNNLLLLAEHHNSAVRRPIFDILLVLTKHKEGCEFLNRKEFDSFLAGKMEFWAHLTRTGLRNYLRMKHEIQTMTKILSALIYVFPNHKWRVMKQTKRALKILMIGEDQHNEIFEGVLHRIEEITQQFERRDENQSENQSCTPHYKGNYPRTPPEVSHKVDFQKNKVDTAPTGMGKFTSEIPKEKEESAFVIENIINVQSDLFTHIVDVKDCTDIRPLELAEIICGLLNTNSDCCVIFGLTSDSIVTGISMKENDIKTFLKDIEIIMKRFVRPPLLDSNFSVKFLPVLENKNGRLQVKPENHVIQIKLYPHKRVVYSLHDGTKYYTRKGTTTIEHSTVKKCTKENEQNSIDKSKGAQSGRSQCDLNRNEKIPELLQEQFDSPRNYNKADSIMKDENRLQSLQSCPEVHSSGNLITPVFHFIKRLIPNGTNE